jgi:cytidylate kinase
VAQTLSTSDLEHPFLKLEETGARASQIAVHSVIRDTLNSHIRVLCRHIQRPYSGAVLDGRDIGTVVYPDADVKFFITASEDVRAQRRAKELSMRDTTQSYESILTHIQERDMRDRSRSVAPLTASADAYSIDTTLLTLDQACETVLDIVKRHVLNAMPAALTS